MTDTKAEYVPLSDLLRQVRNGNPYDYTTQPFSSRAYDEGVCDAFEFLARNSEGAPGNVVVTVYIDGEHQVSVDSSKFKRLGGDQCFLDFIPDDSRYPPFRLEFDRA